MSAAKGDAPRKVNGAKFRKNYDGINWGDPEWPDVIGSGGEFTCTTPHSIAAADAFFAAVGMQRANDAWQVEYEYPPCRGINMCAWLGKSEESARQTFAAKHPIARIRKITKI